MKFVNPDYGLDMQLSDERPAILVIESKRLRAEIVDKLHRQCSGEDGNFVLSEGQKVLKLPKVMDFILEPFTLDINNRKVLTKLYQKMTEYGNEVLYEEQSQINRRIIELFDRISLNVPYNIEYGLDFNVESLCKAYDVRLETSGDGLLNKIMDYVKVMNQLCGYKAFAMLNMNFYLNVEEVKFLYEFAAYQKICLLMMEFEMPALIPDNNCCIIDGDCCMIEIR